LWERLPAQAIEEVQEHRSTAGGLVVRHVGVDVAVLGAALTVVIECDVLHDEHVGVVVTLRGGAQMGEELPGVRGAERWDSDGGNWRGCVLISRRGLAGVSPVRVVAKQLGSWWPR
jgi:hypothetical protein